MRRRRFPAGRLAAGADDRLEHELLSPHAVGGTHIFRKLMFSEPEPLGTHLTSRPSQSGTKSQWTIGIRKPTFGPVLSRVSVCTVFERKGCSTVARSVPSFSAA
jgi:hypothetical protein